jgi:hypothetical protein
MNEFETRKVKKLLPFWDYVILFKSCLLLFCDKNARSNKKIISNISYYILFKEVEQIFIVISYEVCKKISSHVSGKFEAKVEH